MPADPAQTPAEEARQADTADGGWQVESHSAAPDLAPTDTTASAAPATGAVQPPEPAANDQSGDADFSADTDGQSQNADTAAGTAAAAQTRDQKTGQFVKPKKRSVQQRIDDMRRAQGDAERRVQQLERELATLRQAPASTTARPAAAPAQTATADPMPEPPKYGDFATDEEYQQAYAKWRSKDLPDWQTRRETQRTDRLKQELTGSLEERLAQERRAAASRAREAQLDQRMQAMHEAHPDFEEQTQANAEVLSAVKSPFLQDLIVNTPDGAEFLYDLASDAELTLALAELPLPTRPLADAIRFSPAARTLMKHFATDEGRQDFLRLRQLHPIRVLSEVGHLEARLTAADRGSVAGVSRPITAAIPPAKPPVGSPRARAPQPGPTAPTGTFEDWMKAEDARERQERLQRAGGTAVHA